MWDLIVSVPDHCLSFYFALSLFTFVYNCIKILKLETFYRISMTNIVTSYV